MLFLRLSKPSLLEAKKSILIGLLAYNLAISLVIGDQACIQPKARSKEAATIIVKRLFVLVLINWFLEKCFIAVLGLALPCMERRSDISGNTWDRLV